MPLPKPRADNLPGLGQAKATGREIVTLPPDFWLTGPPPALLWQTVGTGAMRIAYARPLPEMLS